MPIEERYPINNQPSLAFDQIGGFWIAGFAEVVINKRQRDRDKRGNENMSDSMLNTLG